jgi:hypothetical protein
MDNNEVHPKGCECVWCENIKLGQQNRQLRGALESNKHYIEDYWCDTSAKSYAVLIDWLYQNSVNALGEQETEHGRE